MYSAIRMALRRHTHTFGARTATIRSLKSLFRLPFDCTAARHLPHNIGSLKKPTMKPLLPLLLALLIPFATAQAPKKHTMPQDTLPTAILIDDSPIAADGGSMLLQTQTASGAKRSYLRLRSLDVQGTPDYNRLTNDSGHTLTTAEKAALFARLRELRAKLDDSGKRYLDDFLDETPR